MVPILVTGLDKVDMKIGAMIPIDEILMMTLDVVDMSIGADMIVTHTTDIENGSINEKLKSIEIIYRSPPRGYGSYDRHPRHDPYDRYAPPRDSYYDRYGPPEANRYGHPPPRDAYDRYGPPPPRYKKV